MNFYYKEWKASLPDDIEYPCVVLTTNNWDDYGYKTTFNFTYYDDYGILLIFQRAGIKILQKGENITHLPDRFESLDHNFCSLGQSIEYYSRLCSLGQSIYQTILTALRDTVYTSVDESFLFVPSGFSHSLLRFSEAEKAYKEAAELFPELNKKNVKKDKFIFTFVCKVEGAQNDHIIHFDFSQEPTGLFRITALIGKNGTGKTQVLASFARSMSGLKRTDNDFSPSRPRFSKVISISYSVFDQFSRPSDEIEQQRRSTSNSTSDNLENQQQWDEEQKRLTKESSLFSYVYCGMRKDINNLLTSEEMKDKLDTAFSQINKANRLSMWKEILNPLLDNQLSDANSEHWMNGDTLSRPFYHQLSSGQRILLLVLTEVIATIEEESIVLFDEPELHLHPEAISALARALHFLLTKFNSYGIIATHSPILLQEIPSKHVRILRRQGSFVLVDPLETESFGENLTAIIDQVFETAGHHNNYKDHLRNLLGEYHQQQILSFFDGRLSFNARAALSALEKSSKDGQHE